MQPAHNEPGSPARDPAASQPNGDPQPPPARPLRGSWPSQIAAGVLLAAVTLLLAVVILTPVALSSQDLIDWAAAPTGLNLPHPWPLLVFVALDAAAGVCVLLTVYSAWRGEPAGVFGLLVWCFAAGSAFANWRHANAPGAAPDAVWFFPAMSVAGPALLEAVLARFRRWIQRDTGRRGKPVPTFGWRRWTPGLGSLRDTYGAYRTALLVGVDTVDAAVAAYHQLCPDGSLRVAAALRERHAARTGHDSSRTSEEPSAHAPVDLMRRIPINHEAYQRWQAVWTDLQHSDPAAVAKQHELSTRQIQFVRSAGRLGLLNAADPPALRLAQLAATDQITQPDPARP